MNPVCPKNQDIPANEYGFTLVEALVALALGVAVVSVVLTTLHTASRGAARALEGATATEGFARAGTVLTGDALHAMRLNGAQGLIFQGRTDRVMFPAIARSGGQVVALRFEMRRGSLLRAQAPMLAEGPGPFDGGLTIWQGPGDWSFRYLDDAGHWQRVWTGAGLPRAFGLAATTAPQVVELIAAFPDMAEPDCALGPGPKCSLDSQVFP